MDFDFNLILVPLTLFFLVIWFLDKKVWKQRAALRVIAMEVNQHQQVLARLTAEKEQAEAQQATPAELDLLDKKINQAKTAAIVSDTQLQQTHVREVVNWAYDLLPILLLVLVVRSFLLEPFNIPSESMVPTLQTGDYIVVNKFSYGLRLPLSHTKVLAVGEPQRGDVAVFRYPLQPSINYIKRIVGLPGDTVSYDEGIVSINGQPVSKVPQPEPAEMDAEFERFYTEQLGTHTHTIRELNGVWTAAKAPFINQVNQGEFAQYAGHKWSVTVPEGHYFAMGDNRDESADSRFWGFVPEGNLSGRAVYIWAHKDPGFHLPTFSRNGIIP